MNKLKEDYFKLLESGMFWEFYPEFSGDWDKDKEEWRIDRENWQRNFDRKVKENLLKKESVDFSKEYDTCQKILNKSSLNDKVTEEVSWHKISNNPTEPNKNQNMLYNYYISTGTGEPYIKMYNDSNGKRELQLVYPGKKKEDFNLTLTGNLLNIEVGLLVKEYTVPPDTDKNQISAKYEAGILHISLPFKKPKTIKVN